MSGQVSESEIQSLSSNAKQQMLEQLSIAESKLQADHTRHQTTRQLVILILICFIALLVSVYVKIRALSTMYPQAYRWWRTGSYSSVKNPPGLGPRKITVESCAISAVYPSFSWFLGLTFVATPLKPAAAEFLLHMVSIFGDPLRSSKGTLVFRGLTAVHWNGTEEQLSYSRWRDFLPPGDRGGIRLPANNQINWSYIYADCWAGPTGKKGETANPWFERIWPNVSAFQNSPLIQDYYNKGRVDAIDSLFRGGLTAYALAMQNESKTADEMLYYFVGSDPITKKMPCDTKQKLEKGFSGAAMVAGMGTPMLAMAGAAMGPFALVLLGASALWGSHEAQNAKCGEEKAFPELTKGVKDELNSRTLE